METPYRPMVLATPPPMLRPNFKRQYIRGDEDKEFVPTKLHFSSPVLDEATRSNMDAGGSATDELPVTEVSQVRQGLPEDHAKTQEPSYQIKYLSEAESKMWEALLDSPKDSQELVLTESPHTKYHSDSEPELSDDHVAENSPNQERSAMVLQPLGIPPQQRVDLMRRVLHMDVDEETESVPPLERKSTMRSIIRACVYGVLKHCIREFLFDSCEGCIIQAPGQSSHVCLIWSEKNIDGKVKYICDNLSINSIVVLATSIAYALKCLVFTQEHMDEICNLVNKVGDTLDSREALEKDIVVDTDKKMIQYVESYVKDQHYKRFLH